jgi:hypothetical protein
LKKALFPLFIILLGVSNPSLVFAQLQKGNLMLGGGLNFNHSNIENFDFINAASTYETRSFTFNPRFGYFIGDTWIVGLEGNYSKFHQNVNATSPSASTSITDTKGIRGGVFVRKFFPIQAKLAFFGQFSSSYLSRNRKNSIDQNNDILGFENITRAWDNRMGIGLAFFPTNWIAVELEVNPMNFGLNWTETKASNSAGWGRETSSSYFDFTLNTTSVFIGANFFINRKK